VIFGCQWLAQLHFSDETLDRFNDWADANFAGGGFEAVLGLR